MSWLERASNLISCSYLLSLFGFYWVGSLLPPWNNRELACPLPCEIHGSSLAILCLSGLYVFFSWFLLCNSFPSWWSCTARLFGFPIGPDEVVVFKIWRVWGDSVAREGVREVVLESVEFLLDLVKNVRFHFLWVASCDWNFLISNPGEFLSPWIGKVCRVSINTDSKWSKPMSL